MFMVEKFNKNHGEVIEHSSSGFNIEDVAKELEIKEESIVKAILMDYKNEEPVLCIIRVVDKLKTKNIKKITGFKFSFMKEENLEKLNLSAGAIPPFVGFVLNIKTYIDKNLTDEFYYGSGGSIFNACKFRVKNYLELGAKIANLTSEFV